jgi:localization factor PodJL
MLPDKNNIGNGKNSASEPNRTPAEVRQLLNVIAGQIASADFKTSANLDDIKARLAMLQHQAQTAKAEATGELAGEFERIEASLAELTTMVPDALSGEVSDGLSAPAALRSAVSGWTDNARSGGNKADPFDIVDNGIASTDSAAWSETDAEKLTRVYEEANFKEALQSPTPVANVSTMKHDVATIVKEPTAAMPALQGITQPWLEERFAEIADGLETILDETHPRATIAALDDRLSKLETHLTSVLQTTSRNADPDALKQIEAYIGDLAMQLEKAQGQFGRIDTIESQLNAVVDHLAAQLEQQTAASPQMAAADLQRLVQDAAEVTAQRFAAAAQPLAALSAAPAPTADIDGIRQLLESYIGERRQGEEHNSLMLDTVQQALIRVLDRMDSLEVAHEKAASHASSKPVAPTSYNPAPATSDVSIRSDGMERRSNPERRGPDADPIIYTAAAAASVVPTRPSIAVAPEPAAPAQQAASNTGMDKLRQDFVADAQRGRQRAASMKSEQQTIADASMLDMQPAASHSLRGEIKTDSDRTVSDVTSGPSRMPSKKVLLAAGLALALIASFALAKKSIPQPTPDSIAAPALESTNPSATNDQASEAVPEVKGATQQIMPGISAPSATDVPVPHSSLQFEPEADNDLAAKQTALSRDLPGLRLRAPDTKQSVAEISLMQQQQKLAELSNQVGETAANMMTPAAFMQEVPLTKVPPTVTATTAQGRSSALDLPPVTVGPLSMRLAAGKGDPSAEFEAGSRLAEGKGTAQDFKEAMRWYQRSASKGFAQAQYRLGTMYERGLGTKADLGMARNWYQRAAEQGNIKAMHNLAVLSAGRQNGSPDYTTASKWFTDAASRDLKDSQYNLGVLYENGLGVEKSPVQAAKWFSLAARSGDAESVRRRDVMKAQLTTTDQTQLAQTIATYKPVVEANPIVNDARAAGEDWKKRAVTAEKLPEAVEANVDTTIDADANVDANAEATAE